MVTAPRIQEVEVVERKGLGHTDTICDGIAEHISVRLCRYYLEKFGLIVHHNVDKVLLCGGSALPAFGGGKVVRPIEIVERDRIQLTVGCALVGRFIPKMSTQRETLTRVSSETRSAQSFRRNSSR
jgi:S-adenosylmethionine synthetase